MALVYCARCGDIEEMHDPLLGYCNVPRCKCVQFVSEEDELESRLAEGEDIRPLNFDHDEDAA